MAIPEKGPSRRPQHVTRDIWYYEERTKIRVYVDASLARAAVAQCITCIAFTIPKRKLKASLKRME